MKFRLVILPPQSDRSRTLAGLIASAVPEADVVTAETEEDAKRGIATADAAYVPVRSRAAVDQCRR